MQYDDYERPSFSPNRPPRPRNFQNNYRNDRYNNAYGDYTGGYGPPRGGFRRDGLCPRYDDFGPPRGEFSQPSGFNPAPDVHYMNPYSSSPMYPPPPPSPPDDTWGKGFGPEGPPILRRPNEDKTVKFLLRCGVSKEHLKNVPRDLLKLMEPEFCGLCSVTMESHVMSCAHYISKNHMKNQKKWLNQQMDFRRVKELPFKARELYCELCDVHITSKAHSDAHYSGKLHRAIVDERRKPKNPILLQQGMESRVEHLIRREKRALKFSSVAEKVEKEPASVQPEFRCDICKTTVTCSDQMTSHLNGKKHLSKEKQYILRMMKGEIPPEDIPNQSQEGEGVGENENTEQNEGKDGGKDECEKEGEKPRKQTAKDLDWVNGDGNWGDEEHRD